MGQPRTVRVFPVTGIGEVRAGDDLAALVTASMSLRDGDILVLTSKVVSKAEGHVVTLGGGTDRAALLADQTDRVVARRGGTSIVRTRHGLVMAAAGIDASNTEPGTAVLLPEDPDRSARTLREVLHSRPLTRTRGHRSGDTGPNVAVLISDTSGRAWRNGQTDLAVGAAGLLVLDDHADREDGYGNALVVTAPAVADEVTAAADLATGKLSRSPAAVVRGLDDLVLPPGEHGPGAAALVRSEETDMFGLGAREAVVAALTRTARRGFGSPAPSRDLVEAIRLLAPGTEATTDDASDHRPVDVCLPPDPSVPLAVVVDRAVTLAHALGWALGRAWDAAPAGPGDAAPARLRFITPDP